MSTQNEPQSLVDARQGNFPAWDSAIATWKKASPWLTLGIASFWLGMLYAKHSKRRV